MATLEIIDSGLEKYSIKSDTNVLGRMYDNNAEGVDIIIPEAEAKSVCYANVMSCDGEIIARIKIENNLLPISSNLTQYCEIYIGFSFVRPDGTEKQSEQLKFGFLYAIKPKNFTPEKSDSEKAFLKLMDSGFVKLIQDGDTVKFYNWQDIVVGTIRHEGINGFEIVDELPTENIDPHTIYLVKETVGEADDYYNEYIYVNGEWELLGSTRIDLSDYYTKEQVDKITEDLTSLFNGKISTINVKIDVINENVDGINENIDTINANINILNENINKKFDKAGGTVMGDMVVGGNLTVQGKTTTVDSEKLRVTDKLIEVGKDNTAPLTSPAGLYTPKYDGVNNGGIVYDNTGTAYVGDIVLDENGNVDVEKSNLQPIATRENAADWENKHVAVWDKENQRLADGDAALSTDALEHTVAVRKTDGRLSFHDGEEDSDGVTVKQFKALNIQSGAGTSSIRQNADPKYNGVVKAATKNPYAKVLYPALTDEEPIGAIGDYAASFGGNSSVQAKRGIGGGTSSVTKGAYSQSLGDNTVTTPNASDSTAIGYQTTTDAPAAFTHGSYAVVMSKKYVEGMFDPNVEPGQGGSGQPTEPGTTPADTLEMDTRRGEAASAGGFNSYSSGFAAETDGVSNVADGHISKSSGRSNRSWSYLSKTDGKNSVVKPDDTDTDATGEGSWANGDSINIVGAKYAYAGGINNAVYKGADNSFSYGEGLQTKNKNQTVVGQYNDSTNPDEIFGIGVGASADNRKTSFKATKDGKVYYNDFEVSNQQTTSNAINDLNNILSPKVDSNTTEITNLWSTVRETNSNLNRLNETKYDKTGGTINGDVTITGKAKVDTAPTASNDVVRKLELDALKAELQAYTDNATARYVSTSILGG